MINLVYIAGSGRSGSTLLERMLSQIDEFVTVGELRHLWRADYEADLCGCGQTFKTCPFWQPILSNVFADKGGVDFESILTLRNQVDRIRYLPYMITLRQPAIYRKRYELYISIIQSIYQQLETKHKNAFIVDSSKDISTLYLLARLPSIKLHVVHMVRDSRAVAYSRQRKRVNPQFVKQVKYLATYSPTYAAWDWLYRNTFVEWGRSLYHCYHALRYEDLVNDPVTTMGKLCTTLEINEPDFQFISASHVDLSKPAHTVSGNPMRFESGPTMLKLDLAWEQKMKKEDKWIVTGLTWPLLIRYRYALSTKSVSLYTAGIIR
jgi:hypothetical protein